MSTDSQGGLPIAESQRALVRHITLAEAAVRRFG
jgi:hypothetical protein